MVAIIQQLNCLRLNVVVKISPIILKILGYQLMIIMLVGIAFGLFKSVNELVFSMLGGMVAFIPNAYFALRTNQSFGKEAKEILNSFYVAEAIKLLLTASFFLMAFQLPNVQIIPLLTGFITALSISWFALLIR